MALRAGLCREILIASRFQRVHVSFQDGIRGANVCGFEPSRNMLWAFGVTDRNQNQNYLRGLRMMAQGFQTQGQVGVFAGPTSTPG